jgi:hypothetical protein
MGIWNIFTSNKNNAKENNYKLDLFETVSRDSEIADMSVIKRYFNRQYEYNNDGFNTFSVQQNFEGFDAA